jgi:hypothetical protein
MHLFADNLHLSLVTYMSGQALKIVIFAKSDHLYHVQNREAAISDNIRACHCAAADIVGKGAGINAALLRPSTREGQL